MLETLRTSTIVLSRQIEPTQEEVSPTALITYSTTENLVKAPFMNPPWPSGTEPTKKPFHSPTMDLSAKHSKRPAIASILSQTNPLMRPSKSPN